MAFEFFKNLISKIKNAGKKQKKKLGLALGSGGARGLAHIGILRAFEDEGINFDYVAGSSIGSIIGGLYCAGYSTASMNAYLKELNITDPQTLILYKLKGFTVEKILDRALGSCEFDELDPPFTAVCSDIESGKEVRIKSGNVARSMCASSAIPPVFKPCVIDGKKLIDGAYTACVPTDAVKEMGADVIIGVNLSKEVEDTFLITKALDEMYKGHGIKVYDRKETYKNCDFMLEPDLEGYSSSSLRFFDEIEEIGYKLCKEKMPEIKQMLIKKGVIQK